MSTNNQFLAEPIIRKYKREMSAISKKFMELHSINFKEENDFEKVGVGLRKIIEGIAYACLFVIDNAGFKLNSKAKKEYRADFLFKNVISPHGVFPSPSVLRKATSTDPFGVSHVIEGKPERR